MERISDIKKLSDNRYLNLYELDATFRDGSRAPYYVASRRKSEETIKASTHDNQADGVILYGVYGEEKDKVVLIRQYRPPLDRFAIEFPAGLIDDGEEPGEAALRELREETGYKGELKKLSDRAYSSPGLTDEFLIFARVEIDPAVQGEIQTDFDEAESIETFLVAPDKLNEFLENARRNGDVVDAKVVAYAFSTDLV